MNVHIVCKEPNPEHILHRLAATLCDTTGWTMGKTTRGDADLCYFLPYLNYEPVDTATAAWFTHFDAASEEKAQRWLRAAQAVNLRTTSAAQYAERLAPTGATARVPVPLDRTAFALAEAPTTFTVGVSGFVYHDGRKGEDLIRRLAQEFRKFDWRAIGRGWSVPTRQIASIDLPGFYQSLSLFVCASRVEGVPYPPLEALACGVPVIIPRGVGLLDDLPVTDGIFRFEAGDYASLKAAFAEALECVGGGAYDRATLRAATEPYTADAWARAHERAFETLLSPAVVEFLPDWRGRAGIYCVAYGDPARKCAERLLRSCARYMPGVPTALVSDRPLGLEQVFIPAEDYDVGGRKAKLSIDQFAPPEWQYILYLDADTELVAPVPFLFDALQDGWEFVIAKNPAKYHTTRLMVRPDNKLEVQKTYDVMGYDDMLQLNGGVFAFRRSSRTAAFFKRWLSEWTQEAKRDQAALLRALWAYPLKTYVLGNEWNHMDEYCADTPCAGIEHHQREARRVSGIVWERGDSPEAFRKVNR